MAGQAGRRTGRPPLTERYRQATRMEIADQAVRLFVTQGVAATTAEQIASAAGVSTRTLWRYFRSKEECARPLLTAGLDMMTERLREHWCAGVPLTQVMPSATDPVVVAAQHMGALRDLVRLTRDEPGLRAIWLETHFTAETVFAGLIAEGTGRSAHDLAVRLEAGMLNAALRIVVEDWALVPDEPGRPDPTDQGGPADRSTDAALGEALARALDLMTRFLDGDGAAAAGIGRKR
ncbi:TetR/AcrR family transcriptional regulator [Yinghuangia sp. ASG 101]|uniref:TetR/AcrR family transcriptional regulator n=1 Tax=Yinghuangia sp. ASG 101 TaxID=2896848 RepID=UPI001E4E8FD0|nr:TetR/AcrR family transcriptional regulator [Yinghuangia sp. ASG 101]UGQ12842.1 TetR/AcrR family transcriptional regulator [Yinghuangia sp. ASG 101]